MYYLHFVDKVADKEGGKKTDSNQSGRQAVVTKPLRPCHSPGRPFSDQDILESAYEGHGRIIAATMSCKIQRWIEKYSNEIIVSYPVFRSYTRAGENCRGQVLLLQEACSKIAPWRIPMEKQPSVPTCEHPNGLTYLQ